METITVNLRDVPEDIVRRAKAFAALQGISLKEFVLRAVKQALERDESQGLANAFFTLGEQAGSVAPRQTLKKKLRRKPVS